MIDDVRYSIQKARRGIILDTNLLMVYLIGRWNVRKIPEFDRTKAYDMDDFRLIVALLKHTKQLVTTPHILTEVCNLTDTINRKHKQLLFGTLAKIQLRAKERRQEATYLMGDRFQNPFRRLGIADTSLLDASLKGHLVLTDDAGCMVSIYQAGGLVLNINHLRSNAWLC